MPTRKKFAFERFFSLKQHRRRHGAKKALEAIQDFKSMKQTVIDAESKMYTYGSENDLSQHLENLRKEFHGASELEFYHAKLNVLLRRKFETAKTFQKLCDLWEKEYEFLIQHLNTRWLISAVDSFIDHHPDPLMKAYAFAASAIVNTCKIYETERYANNTTSTPDVAKHVEELQTKRVAFFDGTSAFAIGTDDTLRNMRWRLDSLQESPPTSLILKEVFNRINTHETAYKRLKEKHTRKNTVWW